MQKNIGEAIAALTEKPMLATSAERFLILDRIKSAYPHLPQPLRMSKMLSVLLKEVSVPIEDYDLIAGRCVDRLLTDDEEARFTAFLRHPDCPNKATLYSSGHCTYSWDMVVEEGLPGMRKMAETRLQSAENEDERVFLTAILEIYDAIADYMLRYASAAEARGMTMVAHNLREGATEVPQHFASALQLLWTITFIDCAYVTLNPTLTVGRLDQLLYPLYSRDIASGILTEDEARAYIIDYYCKHNLIMGRGEHQVGDETNSTTFQRICCFDAPQYMMLAGTDREGRLAVNRLTELFAECIEPAFKNPVVVVRYVVGMDRDASALWKTLTEKALKSASMMFYNDDNLLRTYRRIGLPQEDAVRYTHFGCNWSSPGDNGAWVQGGPKSNRFNAYRSPEEEKLLTGPYMRTLGKNGWPGVLLEELEVLAEGERKGETVSIDRLYERFLSRFSAFIDQKLERLRHEVEVRQRRPSAVLTFGDCFFRDSLRTAQCFSAGAKYHFELQSFQMFGTVVDSIIAVDQLVIREKRITLTELLDAVRNDFIDRPDILALCRKAEKYGMDTPLSNAHTERLSHAIPSIVIEKSRPYFEKDRLFLTPCMQSDTWHLKLGEQCGATPDGRRANTPFSQNSRPSNGACVHGLTAMLNAMLHLPNDGLTSGALNLDVDSRDFCGESGRVLFAALLASYFNRGGLHAQVTALSKEDLLDAREHPDRHRDLRVRVTGYSGIYVDICKRLQDDIIARFE